MTSRRLGRQTVALLRPPSVVSYANVGGKFEANGPLAGHFDLLCTDSFFGKDTWEQAESAMQQEALTRALEKSKLEKAAYSLILSLAKVGLYLLLGLSLATSFGIDVTGVVALASVLTLAVSLALQNMLTNVLGGFALGLPHTAEEAAQHFDLSREDAERIFALIRERIGWMDEIGGQ